MSWNVRPSVRAKYEFMDAVTYFESVSISISDKFIMQLFDSLEIIERNPLAYRKVKGNFRQFVLQEMPFLIVSTVHPMKGEVIIHSIFHTARNPQKKFIRSSKKK